jgi:hypothetical protein
MGDQARKTFKEILQEESPRNAFTLETKARTASRLAKIQPQCSASLYSIKYAALRKLFQMPAFAPVILDAWTTSQGFLLSVGLIHSSAKLHLPFNQLNPEVQRSHGTWIARRARGKLWQHMPMVSSLRWESKTAA